MKTLLIISSLIFGTYFSHAATIPVSGNITSNTTWVNTNIYLLSGEVYVKNNATLTIQEGTIIQGDKNSTRPCLVITKGSKIYANGTAALPIIFTSNQAVGSRNPGDWGGLIILGNAPINIPGGSGSIEGLPVSADVSYGGTDPNDSSGVLNYVRVEFGGIAFAPNQEVNGITFGGVGRKTKVENCQVSFSGDDSYEFFGGNVNAKNIIAFNGLDDDFDTDFGFSGNLQFGVSFRHPNLADVSGSNGFESDNDATGTFNGPRTSATISNFTLIGPKANTSTTVNSNYKRGNHIRRSSLESVFNSITMGWPVGLFIDGSSCKNAAMNDSLLYLNNIVAGCNTPLIAQAGGAIDSVIGMNSWFAAKSTGSNIYSTSDSVMLTSPFDSVAPNPMPMAGSPALTGGAFTNARLSGFQQVTYRGAFGSSNWMATWSSFTPKTNVYKEQTATVGVYGAASIGQINVYPNPTSSYINIDFTDNNIESANVSIVDMKGTNVLNKTVSSNNSKIDVSALTAGTYMVNILIDGMNTVKRINIFK